MCGHTYIAQTNKNKGTHSVQCLQALTISEAPDPAPKLYLPHCQTMFCHTMRPRIGW